MDKRHRKFITKICPACNQSFESRADKPTIYCSSKCFGDFRINKRTTKTCPVCGNAFYSRNKNQVTCSNACAATFRCLAKHVNCDFCGKTILRSPSMISNHNFCSHECYHNYLSSKYSGEGHWAWKDGKALSNGYIMVLQEDGTRKGEQRIVAEQVLRRKLLPDEVVHHINGNKLDNRPENLQVMNRTDHVNLHREYITQFRKCSKKIAQLNA